MKAWPVAIAIATALLVAGCAGGDGKSEKEKYIERGDGICAVGTLRIGSEAQARFGNTAAPQQQASRFAKDFVVPTLQHKVVDRLRALRPPPGDKHTVTAIYDAVEKGIHALSANPGLLAKPNAGGVFDEANVRAQAYGFKQCGHN